MSSAAALPPPPSPRPPASAPLTTDVVVVGAGPAGLFQVFQLGLQGLRAHVVDALPDVGGQCQQLYADKAIFDIPAVPTCTGAELVQRLSAQIQPFAPHWHLGQQVQTLAPAPDGRWLVGTDAGQHILAHSVVLAAGVGAFVPRRLKLAQADALYPHSLHYHPADVASLGLAERSVLVHGGDALAVQAALDCVAQQASQVYLLHRRDTFRAPVALLAQLEQARCSGRIQVVTGQPLALEHSGGQLRSVLLQAPDGSQRTLAVQHWLVYQGLSPQLGPIADWGLALEHKQVRVDTASFATSIAGIYAVGDINTYPGKLKLLVCAFHEATLAAFAIAQAHTGGPVPLLYTSSNSQLQHLLGHTPLPSG